MTELLVQVASVVAVGTGGFQVKDLERLATQWAVLVDSGQGDLSDIEQVRNSLEIARREVIQLELTCRPQTGHSAKALPLSVLVCSVPASPRLRFLPVWIGSSMH